MFTGDYLGYLIN